MPNRSFSYRGVLAYLSASRCVQCFDPGDSCHRLFSGNQQDMEVQRKHGIICCLDRPVFGSVHFTAFEQRCLGHHLFIESYNFDFSLIDVDGQYRTEAAEKQQGQIFILDRLSVMGSNLGFVEAARGNFSFCMD